MSKIKSSSLILLCIAIISMVACTKKEQPMDTPFSRLTLGMTEAQIKETEPTWEQQGEYIHITKEYEGLHFETTINPSSLENSIVWTANVTSEDAENNLKIFRQIEDYYTKIYGKSPEQPDTEFNNAKVWRDDKYVTGITLLTLATNYSSVQSSTLTIIIATPEAAEP